MATTSLQRVRRTIEGQPVDHLATQPILMMFAARHAGMSYADYTRDGNLMAEAQLQTASAFGVDCLLTCSDPAREVIDIAGDGSVDWFEDQGPAINEERAALLDKQRLETFRVPDPLGGGRMHDRIRAIERMRRAAGPGMSIVGWVEGPLALAAELRGINHVMVDFIDDPDFLRRLLDFCAAVAVPFALAQIDAGADTIGMSDAAASMLGLDWYRRFIHPVQARICHAIKAQRPDVLLRQHMCGNTDPLIAATAELGVDIHELDFPVDLAAAREALGPGRVILGNVSTIADLLEGTPDDVRAATERCHRICGRHHIVGAGCEVSPATPPENLRAMTEYARAHRP